MKKLKLMMLKKMCSMRETFFIAVLILSGLAAQAQVDSLQSAIKYFSKIEADKANKDLQKMDIERAKTAINVAITHPATMNDPYTWHVRGFIYREIGKVLESGDKSSKSRLEAVESFKKSMKVDTANEYLNDNKKTIRAIANSFFNDAATYFNPSDYKMAISNYEKYREISLFLDPKADLRAKDIEFKNALVSLYFNIYDSDPKKNVDFFDKIKLLCNEVMQIDPENLNANYNLGILYYNQAVNIINEQDYDMDMFQLVEMQEKTVAIFKQSLPYMEKAYTLNPKDKRTLTGLAGIYFSLNEFEKSNEMKAKIESLDKK